MIAPDQWFDQGPPSALGQWAPGANQAQIARMTLPTLKPSAGNTQPTKQ